ncbi:MAG: hypothetical protein A2219_07020 [Elusimicrobia bacterium RIFOXYA2_FULL_50_26]|nr:MAG: hypothetical protein A2219_07020 [Elusimicrobia bacterium RIFOXYA2_FULL_50_26]OGS24771.1 MAG: hypothetical protein A2314_05275 [Elusimicrobia bacterium RIFOXYB2_FULL_50_12]
MKNGFPSFIIPLLISGAVCVKTVSAATYYVPDNFGSLQEALAGISGGDTLIIRDGTYTGGGNIIDYSHMPPNGSAAAYTVIKAGNAGKVVIDGENARIPVQMDNVSYIALEGIVFKNSSAAVVSITNSNHIKILRCGICDANNQDLIYGDSLFFRYVDYGLIEDTYIWGNGRYRFYMLDSDHLVLRRCIDRYDRGVSIGYGNQGSFRLYGTSNSTLQNCISIDAGPDDYILQHSDDGPPLPASPKIVWVSPNGSSGKSGMNNIISGCIGLNTNSFHFGFVGNSQCSGNIFKNCVFWESENSIWTRSPDIADKISVLHCTFGYAFNADGYHDRAVESDITGVAEVYDSIIYHSGDVALRNTISDYNLLYDNALNYSGGAAGIHDLSSENANEINPVTGVPGNGKPALKYIPRVEDDSDVNNIASDGGDMGASVLYRIGRDGTLWGEEGYDEITSNPLWPWPDEDIIKEQMRSYHYDPGDGRLPLTGLRGFCASGTGLYGGAITLTSYIWEYIGNGCPSNICNYENLENTTPPDSPHNLSIR